MSGGTFSGRRKGGKLPAGVRLGSIDEKLLAAELPPPPDPDKANYHDRVPHVLVSGPTPMLVELCGRRAREGGAAYEEGEENVVGALHPALGGLLRKLGYRAAQVKWL